MRTKALAFVALCLLASLGSTDRATAQGTVPGDACLKPAGSFRLSTGPDVSGAGYMLVCDGGFWQPVFGYSSADRWIMFNSSGLAAAPLHVWGEAIIGNQGLTCAAVAEGALRYTSATDTWDYCDGASWSAFGATATPAGADRQIQFNSAGAFAADTNLVYTSAGWLGVGTATPQAFADFNSNRSDPCAARHDAGAPRRKCPAAGCGRHVPLQHAEKALRGVSGRPVERPDNRAGRRRPRPC